MKCPKCGEDLGLNNICINPMCINFGNEITSNQTQNSENSSKSTDSSLNNSSFNNNYANRNTNSKNFDNRNNTSFNNKKNSINVNQNINNNAYISDEEFEAFFDNKNSNYYLGHLSQYRSNNKFTSWNWPAFLFTFYWLLYRKLYGVAALLFVGNFAITLVFNGLPVSLILRILLGVFANCIYLRSCEQKIKQVKSFCRNSSREDYMKRLNIKGGVNLVAPIIFVVLLVLLIITIAIVAFFIFSNNTSSTTHSFYYYY